MSFKFSHLKKTQWFMRDLYHVILFTRRFSQQCSYIISDMSDSLCVICTMWYCSLDDFLDTVHRFLNTTTLYQDYVIDYVRTYMSSIRYSYGVWFDNFFFLKKINRALRCFRPWNVVVQVNWKWKRFFECYHIQMARITSTYKTLYIVIYNRTKTPYT